MKRKDTMRTTRGHIHRRFADGAICIAQEKLKETILGLSQKMEVYET